MSSDHYTFEEPQRHPLVRAYNVAGYFMRRNGWFKPLTAKDILDWARRRCKLHDLGNRYFFDALSHLAKALQEEAELTPFGSLFIRLALVANVSQRLRIQDYLHLHPEVLDTQLHDPLIVVGMPRSGTTLLFNLLAQDPSARALLFWESTQPVPVQTLLRGADARVRNARLVANLSHWLAPDLTRIHPVDPAGPEECTWLMAHTLVSPIFSMFGRIPSYLDWLWRLDDEVWELVYRDYVLQLKILQHQNGGGHWVLKSPVHLMSLGPLLHAVPEAKVILADRDPMEVVPSACSLFGVFRSISAEQIDSHALGSEMLDFLSKAMGRAAAAEVRYPERVLRVPYRSLTSDKIGSVRRIYSHFGLPFSEQYDTRLHQWLGASKHTATHNYGLSQFGLSEQMIRKSFPGSS